MPWIDAVILKVTTVGELREDGTKNNKNARENYQVFLTLFVPY